MGILSVKTRYYILKTAFFDKNVTNKKSRKIKHFQKHKNAESKRWFAFGIRTTSYHFNFAPFPPPCQMQKILKVAEKKRPFALVAWVHFYTHQSGGGRKENGKNKSFLSVNRNICFLQNIFGPSKRIGVLC